MRNKTQNDLLFLEWAKQVSAQHPDILGSMKKSTDPLERVIAKQILEAAGGGKSV